MLNQDHPEDERLSALAAGDTDALNDAASSTHLTSCDRCAGVVAELRMMRSVLAEMPDVAPHRPLRLLPPVEADSPGTVDRLGQWAKRLFAPALTAGAALAMVGMVGTALPGLSGAQSGAGGAGSEDTRLQVEAASSQAAAASDGQEMAPFATEEIVGSGSGENDGLGTGATTEGEGGTSSTDEGINRDFGDTDARGAVDAFQADRSPWPMVLFAGIALMIGAALLRWILVPRAT
ncbi:MAG: hypothetical protein ACR2F5_03015 [Candidatus Limnocylindria bacterium]